MVDVWESMGRTLLALGAVLLLMGAVAWVARRVFAQRMGLSGGTPLIQVVANSYLAPRQSIALVAIAGQYFAVGVTAETLIPLGRIEATEQLATLVTSSGQTGIPNGLSPRNLLSAQWWQDVTNALGQGKQGGPHV
ncbi:flagellar biosynthetic protein FliO [Nitrospira lenta]|uniref:Putative Flagellar biosynthetic protein FliO, export component n=1 Tax=Nitrospira lenta TaxID=1436998 RepID=A0A330L5S7_9BACT|nr:flagellar biosynthetic protein FliO [Nitrospira lenta]SPP65199.1 putative Flagellar biosynthetic protein FliO, export component [Nitrospira lenta]